MRAAAGAVGRAAALPEPPQRVPQAIEVIAGSPCRVLGASRRANLVQMP